MDIEDRRKRARFRAWHRGTRELDLILGPFADAHLSGWQAEAVSRFETLLDEEEVHLQGWLTGQVGLPEGADAELVEEIRSFQLQRAAR